MKIDRWMEQYIEFVKQTFRERVWFIGLQGSYARGEATEQSDIDVVMILDRVLPEDLHVYSAMLDQLPERKKICGFLSGKAELLAWEPSELFQFYHDTKPIYGSLDVLKPLLTSDALECAIRTGACGIYHMCGHNMVHEKDPMILANLYKSAIFVLQALTYRETGVYQANRGSLHHVLTAENKLILQNAMQIKTSSDISRETFLVWSGQLFEWAGKLILL